jgi:CDGSH-type Zn-finger protein
MNSITVTANGPYECRGELRLVDAEGKPVASATEAWLCRCGQSQNKPYCDGHHATVKFRNDTFSSAPGEPAPLPDAPLGIKLRKDGPLRLDGPCEVRAPDGSPLYRGRETALCRCGQSGRKPFCDGTHRTTGFVA